MMRTGCCVASLIAAGLLLAGRVGGVAAQETPRHGGERVFVVPAEPPSFDAHREERFALIHPAAPHIYQRQSRATDREERRHAIREFEKRLLDDEVHYIFTFQWHRIVRHNARLRGWTITPSQFLNNQLDTVWLAPE
jgi:ABC-type transport system substrate-binding protein